MSLRFFVIDLALAPIVTVSGVIILLKEIL